MTRTEKAFKLKDADFKQIMGIKKETFLEMVEILNISYANKHKRRGRHTLLSNDDKLF